MTAQLTKDIPEEVFRNSEHYDKRLRDQLRNGDGIVKVHAGKSTMATNLHTKVLKSGDANMNTLAYVDPHLVACSVTSANQLRVACSSRMCSCTAYEAYYPNTPKMWICWDYQKAMKIGAASPDGQVIPFLLSTYQPVMYLVNYPGDPQPTAEELQNMKVVGFSLTRAYKLIVGTPKEMELTNYRRCLQSSWRALMMADVVTAPLMHGQTEKRQQANRDVVSSATDEVVVTYLPFHPLTSLTFFNGGSLFPWRLR